MLSLDTAILATVVATAKQSAASQPRWINAIERAASEMMSNPYIEIAGDHLLIGSPSGNCYDVNGTCQCRAVEVSRPCWHRAAKQLLVRYRQAEKQAAAAKALAEINELF
jgi:hypothetical protein